MKNVLAIIISIIIGVILTEIALTLFFPIDDPYAQWKSSERAGMRYIESQFLPNQHYIFYPEDFLPDMADSVRFTTNSLGFRGSEIERPKPDSEFRAFVIGGSTTECLFLDDTADISYDLEEFLNRYKPDSAGLHVEVYNAGKSGDKSYDHVAMLSQRIVHLHPDLVVIFAGINDLSSGIYGYDYVHEYKKNQYLELGMKNLIKYGLTEFQVPRRLVHMLKKPSDDDLLMAISFHSNYRTLINARKNGTVVNEFPRTNLEAYRNHLLSIIGICRMHNIKLVFMTQPTVWDSKIDPKAKELLWFTYRRGKVFKEDLMDQALEKYNDVMRHLGNEYNVPVFDLAEVIPKSTEYFYDDCHFNITGAEFVADSLCTFILENYPIAHASDSSGL